MTTPQLPDAAAMSTYTVKVERVTVYAVEADSEDTALALVGACELESRIRRQINEAIDDCYVHGPVITGAHETRRVYKALRPMVWLPNPEGGIE